MIFNKASKLSWKPQNVIAEKTVVKEKKHKKIRKKRWNRPVNKNIPVTSQPQKNNSDSLRLLERSKSIEGLKIADTLRIENKKDNDQNPAYQ
ncbi:hypothetical protein [Pedobacter sp. NJ-S-72]